MDCSRAVSKYTQYASDRMSASSEHDVLALCGNRCIRVLSLLLAIGFGCAQNIFALTTNATGLVTYTAFDGTVYTMQPWLGRNIVVLAPPTSGFQTNVMGKVIAGLDRAYDFYEAATARRPQSWDSTTFQGRESLALVDYTWGAGA